MPAPRLVPVENPLVRVQLFGALDARSYQGEIVLPRGLRARAILAYLLLTPDGVIPRKRFLALLWSQRFEEQARQSARQSVRELTVALGRVQPKILEVTRDTIRLDRTRIWIEGLSQRATGETPDAIGFDPASFLETLLGLDPNFDTWIAEMRAGLLVRGQTEAHPVATPPVPVRSTTKRSPRVDVMPFAAFGADADNAHMAPALSHELATGLARFRWISVRLLHGQAAATTTDYRLEGHMAHAPTGGRLTVRLTDSRNADAIVWTHAETIHGPLRPAFVADIAERIVGRLDPEILAIETRKASHGAEVADDAYGLLLRAIPKLHARSFGPKSWLDARGLLEKAMDIEPNYGRAQAFLAQALLQGIAQGWTPPDPMALQRIDRMTAAAVASDPQDSIGLSIAGHIRSFIHKDFDGAKDHFRRAIEANPNCCFAWGYSSLTFAYAGEPREARRRFERAGAALQHGPFDVLLSFETAICYFEQDWQKTISVAREALLRMPGLTTVRKFLIAAMSVLGEYAGAASEQSILIALEPNFTWPTYIETYPFGRQSDRAIMLHAIRAAGLIGGAALQPILNPRLPEKYEYHHSGDCK